MKTMLVFATCLLFSQSGVVAQTPASGYFPLAAGNSWTYCHGDTLHNQVWTIQDTLLIDGEEYSTYVYNTWADTIRSDSAGRIWEYILGKNILWFDFTLTDRATYKVPAASFTPGDSFIVTVSRNITVTTHAGRFENCIQLFFDIPEWIDEEIAYIFAPGVGIVEKRGAWMDDSLYTAVIDGRVISGVEGGGTAPPVWHLEQNYPNPFNSTTIIRFSLGEPAFVSLRVTDIRGRITARLLEEKRQAGSHTVSWSADGAASGVYFLTLSADNFADTKKILLIR
jgi:hypothetical protein